MVDSAIGMFDSGVGGLSIFREVVRLLPHKDVTYVADQGHFPYGEKSVPVIQDRALRISEWLVGEGSTLIVVACNSATVSSIALLRRRFPNISFVGVEPAVKPAAGLSKSGEIAVLTTATTKDSGRQRKLIMDHADAVKVRLIAVPEFVRLVEEGRAFHSRTKTRVQAVLERLRFGNVDTIVLGCTHYPFLMSFLRESLPGVSFIDPSPAVARQVQRLQAAQGKRSKRRQGTYRFFTTDNPKRFHRIAARLLRERPAVVRRLRI